MTLDLETIPTDSEHLRAALMAAMAAHVEIKAERDTLKVLHDEVAAENEKLRNFISQLKRTLYGRRSEKLDPDQLTLALEEFEQTAGTASAAAEPPASGTGKAERPPRSRPPKRNRGALPAHLPRVDVTVDLEDKTCPCCQGALHPIGEEVHEMLDIIPAQFQVKVIHTPKYACRSCGDAVVQAPAPERPITGGMATEALIAHIIVSKFGDHLPLYRQAEIYARQGIDLDRSTLADWVGRAAWWLRPLYDLLTTTALSSPKLFADDTPLPVLDPGRGRTKTGRVWAYARDDRPWKGPLPPLVVYVYEPDRKGERPADHLAGFTGLLQVDGYAGFKRLTGEREAGPIILVFCWSHSRRKFYDVHQATGSPIAAEVLRRIAELYQIEDDIRGQPPDHRRAVRQEKSKPLVEALRAYLEEQLARIPGKSGLAGAIRYVFNHWDGLVRFLDDGRLELDTNTVERSIRPIKLGAKNCLFAGSDAGAETWAIIATLIQTAKLNGVEPFAWLKDGLERMVSGQTKATELHTLLPWAWQPASAA